MSPARPHRAVIRRRSPGDLLLGLAAVAALAALTVGVPFALVTVFGLPVPHTMPRLSALSRPLDVFGILRALSLLVWLAWIQLAWCVIAEVRAAVRNTGLPARVPLAGGTQAVVHRLVSAALLLFAAATALSPAFTARVPAHTAPPAVSAGPRPSAAARPPSRPAALPPQLVGRPHVTPASGARPGRAGPPGGTGSRGPGAGAAEPGGTRPGGTGPGGAASPGTGSPGTGSPGRGAPAPGALGPGSSGPGWSGPALPGTQKVYVVQPPAGRFHQSLWEIAQKFLGDGRRYREIFELNSGRVQPDGSRLTIARLIRPGWVLYLPGDAHGPGIGTAHALAAAPDDRNPADPGRAVTGGPAHRAGDAVAWETAASRAAVVAAPQRSAPDRRSPPVTGSAARTHATGDLAGRQSGGLIYPRELAAAGLLAAGLLAALGRRRREQLWQRAFGRRAAAPDGAAALAEAALRCGASEPSARLLDCGLRYLAHALARSGAALPTVFAAHLSPANLDLWVAPAGLHAPPPWTAVGDGQVWRLPATELDRIAAEPLGEVPALFPGLVSIGTDHAGRVLVDLEAAHGVIAVTGPPDVVTAALSSIALELATSRWSGPMQLTLTGFGASLVRLAPDRITAVPTLDEALPMLHARGAVVPGVMTASGAGSVLTGRSEGADPAAWTPHYLISATPPTPRQARQLLTLARNSPAAAASYLIAGDVPGATWTWELTPEGRLIAGELGFDVQAQLVPAWQRDAVTDLFDVAARTEGVLLSAPPASAAPREHLEPGAAPPAQIAMLGPARVQAPGTVLPGEAALLTEVLVYLAGHPGGVPRGALDRAIWPGGISAADRDAALDRAGEWLGADSIGRPHLAEDATGRLRLGSGVRVDWLVFQALAGHAAAAPPGSAAETGYLARALDEVSGEFLAGRDPAGYGWLATDALRYEVEARVADTAHRLARLRLAAGDGEGALAAARAGLRLAATDELLWRDLLRGAHAAGQPDLLHAVIGEIRAWAVFDGLPARMAPETEALIDELYPAWRSAAGSPWAG